MRQAKRGEFLILDWPKGSEFCIENLWYEFPELVVGRYLVNTCFDCGLLQLSEKLQADGWHVVGGRAHSPRIESHTEIPYDSFDEWLIFETPVEVPEFETMVNHCAFSPTDYVWEEKRERFWEQIFQLRPLHVIGENYGAYFVTRDQDLFDRMLRSEELANAAADPAPETP